MSDPSVTPFRRHFDHCRSLDPERQIEECTDHLQHPQVLLMEFFESHHRIEREFSPDQVLRLGSNEEELVLEPFYASLEISVDAGDPERERIVCMSGSMSPIDDGQHPALSRGGLDYVALRRDPPPRVVLGVTQVEKEETPYVLLLRALNCFAELSPPLRVLQLGREILGGRLPEDARFDLQLGIAQPDAHPANAALIELTRDLAELFQQQIDASEQLSGMLGCIECLEIAPTQDEDGVAMSRIWSLR